MDELQDFDKNLIEKIDKSGKITGRNITDLFGSDRIQARIKAVSNPDAQSTTQCQSADVQEQGGNVLGDVAQRLRDYDKKLYFLFMLQFENALRISEVLSISPTQIDRLGNVMIKGSKGGKSRIIATSVAREYLLQCRQAGICPFSDYNRFYVYRVYKRLGIGVRTQAPHRTAVTHAFRHLTAQAARDASFADELISEKLGHKNLNTQKHYGTSKRQGKKP